MHALRSILLIAIHTLTGLGILIAANTTPMPSWLHESVVIAFVFLLLNIAYDRFFKLGAIREYWALRKLPYILPAAGAGLLIMIFPALLAIATGVLKAEDVQVDTSTSVKAIVITLVIVSWEELWFRGVFLNYCNKHFSPFVLSVLMGILFVLVHLLNPEIELLKKGPALFGAGALHSAVRDVPQAIPNKQ